MTIRQSLIEFFSKEDIRFQQPEHGEIFVLGFAGENGCFTTFAEADEEDRCLTFTTLYPFKAGPEQQGTVAQLLVRANGSCTTGAFGMTEKGGHIDFRTGVFFGPDDIDPHVIQHLLYANWTSVDLWAKAIVAVTCADMPPEQAMRLVHRQVAGLDTLEEGPQRPVRTPRFDHRLGGFRDSSNN